ncbi:MAG: hypothetical protein KJ709_03765 [Nanoarchaeota archaeon]|nr:hypothetical protein [Nanoarchaeota archaeon]
MDEKGKKLLMLGITAILLVAFYFLTHKVSGELLQELGGSLPLPIFTFFIAFVDGFNPCNLFILTLLLTLMISASHSRKRVYAVGFSFITVVFCFYFLFMAAWLNIFTYIGFVEPIRIAIAIIALIAGLINMKELFFYRKGITLMVQDKHVGPLKKRINHVADLVKKGSMASLIGSSVLLAVFSSLVELPCTAGFPVIYTAVLTGQFLENTFLYYAYLALYNLVYVLPLGVIILVFGNTFKGKQISPAIMSYIKFVGGAIMLLLGIILLVNPALIGV